MEAKTENLDGSEALTEAAPPKKYAVSGDEERYHGSFDSREIALACAEDEYGAEAGETAWTGEIAIPDGSEFFPDGGILTNYMVERAGENAGEYAETWMESLSEEAQEALTERLHELLHKWMDDFGERPGFFNVVNVEAGVVPQPEPQDGN